jgi:hypothetical protein
MAHMLPLDGNEVMIITGSLGDELGVDVHMPPTAFECESMKWLAARLH